MDSQYIPTSGAHEEGDLGAGPHTELHPIAGTTSQIGALLSERSPSELPSLPSELLAAIFQLSIDDAVSQVHGLAKQSSVLKLGQTCSRWRAVLHATPTLWTSLVLDLSNPENLPWKNFVDRVVFRMRLWIERSRDLPVSVVVIEAAYGSLGPQISTIPWTHWQRIIYKFRVHSKKWKNVTVVAHESTLRLLGQRNGLLGRSYDTLTRFSVISLSRHADSIHMDLPMVFAPEIRSLSLDIHHPILMHLTKPEWAKLTDLSLLYNPTRLNKAELNQTKLEDILSHTPNLVTCSLGLTSDLKVLSPNSPVIALPHRTTLRLRRTSSISIVPPFMVNIRTPQLKTLEVDAVATFVNSPWNREASTLVVTRLAGLLAHTGCQLETLVMRHLNVASEKVTGLPDKCPALETLVLDAIRGSDMIRAVVLRLTPDDKQASQPPWPSQLRKLEFGCAYQDAPWKELHVMVEARVSCACGEEGLQVFNVKVDCAPSDMDREEVMMLRDYLQEVRKSGRLECGISFCQLYHPTYMSTNV